MLLLLHHRVPILLRIRRLLRRRTRHRNTRIPISTTIDNNSLTRRRPTRPSTQRRQLNPISSRSNQAATRRRRRRRNGLLHRNNRGLYSLLLLGLLLRMLRLVLGWRRGERLRLGLPVRIPGRRLRKPIVVPVSRNSRCRGRCVSRIGIRRWGRWCIGIRPLHMRWWRSVLAIVCRGLGLGLGMRSILTRLGRIGGRTIVGVVVAGSSRRRRLLMLSDRRRNRRR